MLLLLLLKEGQGQTSRLTGAVHHSSDRDTPLLYRRPPRDLLMRQLRPLPNWRDMQTHPVALLTHTALQTSQPRPRWRRTIRPIRGHLQLQLLAVALARTTLPTPPVVREGRDPRHLLPLRQDNHPLHLHHPRRPTIVERIAEVDPTVRRCFQKSPSIVGPLASSFLLASVELTFRVPTVLSTYFLPSVLSLSVSHAIYCPLQSTCFPPLQYAIILY
uniref:Uncharacterized protein n=1 Tax=Anopheles atroparvus TaxID=41427 RepID=A0AAG5DEN6_ANOAO